MKTKMFFHWSGVVEYSLLFVLITVFLSFLYLRLFSYIFIIAFTILGVILFISLNIKGKETADISITINNSHQLKLILNILFFSFYGLSLITLVNSFYTKSILYYVFISLIAITIAAEILIVTSKGEGIINLFKSYLLGLNLFLSNQLVFPFGLGAIDAAGNIFRKEISVTTIIDSGNIPLGHTYSYTPLHFILVAANSIISSIDPAPMYFLLGGVVVSLGSIWVFLIGRKFVNLHFGLFAALLYPSLDYLLFFGSHAHQLSYALLFAIMAFAISLYKIEKSDQRLGILILIFFFTLIFTHHLSSVYYFFILTSMLTVEIMDYFGSSNSNSKFVFNTLFLLFLVGMVSHWMYVSGLINTFANTLNTYIDFFTLERETVRITIYDTLPVKTIFLNTIGSGILMMLSIIGILSFFYNPSFFKKIIMGIFIVLISIIGFDIVTPGHFIMPQRLYVFLDALALVYLASCALLVLSQRRYTRPFVFILTGSLVFFSSTSTIAGFETAPFLGETGYFKAYDTPFEKFTEEWTGAYVNETIGGIRFKGQNVDLENMENESYILLNQFNFINGFGLHRPGTARLSGFSYIKPNREEILSSLDSNYHKCYDNGMLILYVKAV
jgi:hypothetical protein